MVNRSRSPRAGDHVEVDRGTATVLGVVHDVRHVGHQVYALVLIDTLGPNGEVLDQQTVSVPANSLRVLV